MKELKNYLVENTEDVQEGIISDAISLIGFRNISGEELLQGILSMYDYIVDKDNMDLFYQDYPAKQRIFWKNLYKLYQHQAWSIVDVPNYVDYGDDDDDDASKKQNRLQRNRFQKQNDFINSCFPSIGELIKVTPEFRRHLRQFINNSRNNDLDLKPSQPEYMMLIPDEVKDCAYIITINRTTGLLARIFRAADKRYLIKILSEINR